MTAVICLLKIASSNFKMWVNVLPLNAMHDPFALVTSPLTKISPIPALENV